MENIFKNAEISIKEDYCKYKDVRQGRFPDIASFDDWNKRWNSTIHEWVNGSLLLKANDKVVFASEPLGYKKTIYGNASICAKEDNPKILCFYVGEKLHRESEIDLDKVKEYSALFNFANVDENKLMEKYLSEMSCKAIIIKEGDSSYNCVEEPYLKNIEMPVLIKTIK